MLNDADAFYKMHNVLQFWAKASRVQILSFDQLNLVQFNVAASD